MWTCDAKMWMWLLLEELCTQRLGMSTNKQCGYRDTIIVSNSTNSSCFAKERCIPIIAGFRFHDTRHAKIANIVHTDISMGIVFCFGIFLLHPVKIVHLYIDECKHMVSFVCTTDCSEIDTEPGYSSIMPWNMPNKKSILTERKDFLLQLLACTVLCFTRSPRWGTGYEREPANIQNRTQRLPLQQRQTLCETNCQHELRKLTCVLGFLHSSVLFLLAFPLLFCSELK
jgi:hypothetical protein